MKARGLLITLLLFTVGVSWVNTCNHREKETNAVSKVEENIKKRTDSLASIDRHYKEMLAKREKESEKLFEKLVKTESLLQQEKAKVVSMQQKVKFLVQSDWQGISTEEKLIKCDSLREIVVSYEAERQISDSLTEAKVQSLHEIINFKDEQITECDGFYESIKQELEKSISDTKACSEELKKTEKKIKRKQFFNKILVTAGAVVTIVAGVLLLKGAK